MTEEEIRDLFREMREEPVPADSLVRLRTKLAERTGARVWLRRRTAALVFTAACLALFGLFWPSVTVEPPKAPEVSERPADLPIDRQRPAFAPPIARPKAVRHRISRPEHPSPEQTPLLIRIETPDPEVVILLVGE